MLRADGPNRGAWADPSRMTPEVVELYRRPAKLLNWGSALIQVFSDDYDIPNWELVAWPFHT